MIATPDAKLMFELLLVWSYRIPS